MSKPTEKAGADILYTCRMLIQRKTRTCWIETSHSLPKYTQKRQLMTHLWKDCTKGRLGLPMTDFLQRVFSNRNKKKIHKIIIAITTNLVLHRHHCTHWSFCQGIFHSGTDLTQMVMFSTWDSVAREESSRISTTTWIYSICMGLLLILKHANGC